MIQQLDASRSDGIGRNRRSAFDINGRVEFGDKPVSATTATDIGNFRNCALPGAFIDQVLAA